MSAQRQPQRLGWHIGPLRVEHLSRVLAIERRAYDFPWTERIFTDCLNAGYGAWAASGDDGVLVGYALMSMGVGEAHVLNICVSPDYQGRGVGRLLMRHLLGVARQGGVTVMLLEVRKSNTVALRLYRSLGFVRIGLRRGYYPAQGGREDAYVLAHEIT